MSSNNKKISNIIKILKNTYPNAKIALKYRNPLELLVATILSAQCTDIRVNKVTKELFKKYKKAEDYAQSDKIIFEQEIKSCGFFHNKAKNIIDLCNILVIKYNGEVPKTMNQLTALPGVGRKTANIILGSAFGISDGIPVDTHVKRISQRLHISKENNPIKIEQDLMKIIPPIEWLNISYFLIEHGRKICKARNPHCNVCCINKYCPSKDTIN
ncbi:MAG: endonuclease III [Candidatus Firestonebacteria bacterium]|nr:endonuclease III [Candidatus Firestonebacteria bacterium]